MSQLRELHAGDTVVHVDDPNSDPVTVKRVGWDASRLNLKVWVEREGQEYELFRGEVVPVRVESNGDVEFLWP
jgi:hypothetical protein